MSTATPTLTFDAERLDRLIPTKLLVQANSGGGKSYAIRYLLEQTQGRVQHIILDREGEFATLREKFPYLLAGSGGDVAADVRSAKLLARKVMELSLSVIIDLSEMTPARQREYVATFVDALNHLPRTLWHDVIIVIDEAHIFAPEKGKGSSIASEPIALLLSTGRKRGFCVVLATQRLAKLDKDVAAECLNKLIGRTSQEDIARAGDELAMGKEAARALRALEPGQFYAYGPAFGAEPVLVRSGLVKTAPPKRGAERAAAPAAPEKIKRALAELADLPKQAADEEKTIEDARREIADLRRQLAQGKVGKPVAGTATELRHHLKAEYARGHGDGQLAGEQAGRRALAPTITQLRRALEAAMKFIVNISTANFDVAGVDKAELERAITAAVARATQLIDQRLDARGRQIEKLREDAKRLLAALNAVAEAPQDVTVSVDVVKNEPFTVRAERSAGSAGGSGAVRRPDLPPSGDLSAGQQRLLDALAELESFGIASPDRPQVAVLSGFSSLSGGGGAKAVGGLIDCGFVSIPATGQLQLTDAGRQSARFPDTPPTRAALHDRARSKLSGSEQRILDRLIDTWPDAQARTEIAPAVGFTSLSGGGGAKIVGKLVTLGFAEIPSTGHLKAGRILFPEGLT